MGKGREMHLPLLGALVPPLLGELDVPLLPSSYAIYQHPPPPWS